MNCPSKKRANAINESHINIGSLKPINIIEEIFAQVSIKILIYIINNNRIDEKEESKHH